MMPDTDNNFVKQRNAVFTCGGCSGLIKFKLTDKLVAGNAGKGATALMENTQSVISGKIEAILPAELLQVFHMHQKTGRLILEFENVVYWLPVLKILTIRKPFTPCLPKKRERFILFPACRMR
jgi:hypothetical protein